MYAFSTASIAYASLYSPFIAGIFLPSLVGVYVVLFLTSYYVIGFKKISTAWKKGKADAKRRALAERQVRERVKKTLNQHGY